MAACPAAAGWIKDAIQPGVIDVTSASSIAAASIPFSAQNYRKATTLAPLPGCADVMSKLTFGHWVGVD